jgi:hypothetical protein
MAGMNILNMARAAAELDEPHRRYAVKGLVHERYRMNIVSGEPKQPDARCSEADVFNASYGEPSGAEYWRAWLFEKLSNEELANLLATHVADDEARFDSIKKRLISELGKAKLETATETVAWLIENPNTRHLVPKSVQNYIAGTDGSARRPPLRGDASNEAEGGKERDDWRPLAKVREPEVQEFLRTLKPCNEVDARHAAETQFKAKITRERFRSRFNWPKNPRGRLRRR